MKLAVIYDPACPKLTPEHYSRTYLDMFEAVIKRFEQVQHVTDSCSAADIEADVILIYDIHSAHHISIDGLANHKAVKYTYFNDPYQLPVQGVYEGIDVYVEKLGPEARTKRALKRGVDFIICPYSGLYYEHIGPYLGKDAEPMLFWFPPAPSHKRFKLRLRPLAKRLHKILANGIHWGGEGAYDFRIWAYQQPEAFFLNHSAKNQKVPSGLAYGDFLARYAASLALCETRIVPKYLEIPLAGCVCFAQDQEDYRNMGFQHGKNCFFVNKRTFKKQTQKFLAARADDIYYQKVAKEGRILVESKWTAECFADAFYNHAQRLTQPNSKENTDERTGRGNFHTDVCPGPDPRLSGSGVR
jgi:hypothetical protein